MARVVEPMTRYTLDSSVRRAGDGRVLIGGSPLVLLRLTVAGADLIDRIERGEAVSGGPKTAALLDRLLDADIVHPHHAEGAAPEDVTIVVPAYQPSAQALRRIVDACSNTAGVVIVDDASPQPIAPVVGATVIRRDVNGGPAAARTTGLEHVGDSATLVAFVDTDVILSDTWLLPLLAHFADQRVGLVAPRVAGADPDGRHPATAAPRLLRYEHAKSPLDLGSAPARVRAGSRVSYVPAAAIVCRRAALDEVGGFDPALRFGEDVDLVWRLDEGGWRVRYEPEAVVHHEPRPTLKTWMRQPPSSSRQTRSTSSPKRNAGSNPPTSSSAARRQTIAAAGT